jgi:hypothetical protein
VRIDEDVYNGVKKVHSQGKNFMDVESVKDCILNLKRNSSEEFDGIPQQILVDGIKALLESFTKLMNLIYKQKKYQISD